MSIGRRTAVLLAAALLPGVALAAPVSAAQSTQTVTCAGQQLTVRTNDNNSSEHGGWSSVQIVAGGTGHLTPLSFAGTFVDVTLNQTVFSFTQLKGNGNAGGGQPTTTCTQHMEGTLADFLEPGDELPPGASPTDQVTFDLTVVVTARP